MLGLGFNDLRARIVENECKTRHYEFGLACQEEGGHALRQVIVCAKTASQYTMMTVYDFVVSFVG